MTQSRMGMFLPFRVGSRGFIHHQGAHQQHPYLKDVTETFKLMYFRDKKGNNYMNIMKKKISAIRAKD